MDEINKHRLLNLSILYFLALTPFTPLAPVAAGGTLLHKLGRRYLIEETKEQYLREREELEAKRQQNKEYVNKIKNNLMNYSAQFTDYIKQQHKKIKEKWGYMSERISKIKEMRNSQKSRLEEIVD